MDYIDKHENELFLYIGLQNTSFSTAMTLSNKPNVMCLVLDRCYDEENNVYIIPKHLKINAEYQNVYVIDNICKLYLRLNEMNIISTNKSKIIHHIENVYSNMKSMNHSDMSDILKKKYIMYICLS